MKRRFVAVMSFCLLAATFSFAGKVDVEKEKAVIAKTEADFEKARAEHGLEGWMSFFADDAADFVRGGPFTFTKSEMQKRLEKSFDPADKLTWKPVRIDVAASGDLAYSVGTWRLEGKNPAGEEVVQTGKYMTAWRKQKDGSWKVVADTGTSDGPPVKKQ